MRRVIEKNKVIEYIATTPPPSPYVSTAAAATMMKFVITLSLPACPPLSPCVLCAVYSESLQYQVFFQWEIFFLIVIYYLYWGRGGGVLVGVKRPIPKGGGGDSMRNLSPPPPTEKQRI